MAIFHMEPCTMCGDTSNIPAFPPLIAGEWAWVECPHCGSPRDVFEVPASQTPRLDGRLNAKHSRSIDTLVHFMGEHVLFNEGELVCLSRLW